jgi:hypothetical protein
MIDNKLSAGTALHGRYQPAASTVRRRGQRSGKLSTSGRKPIYPAIDLEPVHSPARAFDWHDYLRAIE